MAPLLTRKRVIQIKLEATKGTAETTSFTDLMVFDLTCTTEDEVIERRPSAKVMGYTASGVKSGLGKGSCKFKAEARTTGSSAWDTGLVIALQGCGLALTSQVLAPTSAHTSQKTITIWVFEDGLKKILKGAMGTFKLAPENGRLIFDFEFQGVWTAPADVAMPTLAYGTRAPLIWGRGTGTFTYNSTARYASTFTFDAGNSLVPRVSAGSAAYFMIADRSPKLTFDAEADLVANIDWHGILLAGTQNAVSIVADDGTDTMALAIPKFQLTKIGDGDRGGIATADIEGICCINAIDTGDDEFTLTVT